MHAERAAATINSHLGRRISPFFSPRYFSLSNYFLCQTLQKILFCKYPVTDHIIFVKTIQNTISKVYIWLLNLFAILLPNDSKLRMIRGGRRDLNLFSSNRRHFYCGRTTTRLCQKCDIFIKFSLRAPSCVCHKCDIFNSSFFVPLVSWEITMASVIYD